MHLFQIKNNLNLPNELLVLLKAKYFLKLLILTFVSSATDLEPTLRQSAYFCYFYFQWGKNWRVKHFWLVQDMKQLKNKTTSLRLYLLENKNCWSGKLLVYNVGLANLFVVKIIENIIMFFKTNFLLCFLNALWVEKSARKLIHVWNFFTECR